MSDVPAFNLDPKAPLSADEAVIRDCLDRIKTAQATATTAVAVYNWRMGMCYRSVVQGEKWRQGDRKYKNAEDWGRKVFGKSIALIRAAAGVTRVYEEAIAARGDFSVLVRFLVFANVTGLSPMPKDPWEAPIPVAGPKGTAPTKRLGDCTFREVNAAIARAKKPVAKPLSPEASERMARFRAALAGVLPRGQAFPVVVEERYGTARWGLAKLPQDLFDKVIPALATAWAKVPVKNDSQLQRLEDMAMKAMDMASKVNPQAQDPAKRAAFEAKLKEGLGVLRALADGPKQG